MRYPRTLVGLAFCSALLLVTPALADPGDLDPSFGGGDGMVTNDGDEDGRRIAVLPSGKIVQVGKVDVGDDTVVPHPHDFAVARYNSDGALDDTFGGDGRVRTDFSGGNDAANAVARYGNNKIVVAGWTETATDVHFAVARYNSDGALDDNFGGDGRVITPFPNKGFGYDILVLNDGSIIVVGEDFRGSPRLDNFALAKYRPNGTLATSFSGNGKQTTDFFGGEDGAWNVILQGGRILVAGWGQDGRLPNDDDVALARYNMNGALDDSFHGDGKRLIKLSTNEDDFSAGMLRLEEGRVMIAAEVTRTDPDVSLILLRPDGALGSTFGGGDGKVIRDFGGDELPEGVVRTGERLVVGGATTQENEHAAWRFRMNGALDTGFGTGGEAVSNYPGSDSALGQDIATHDGRVIVSGILGEAFALTGFLLN
jgi:uncharacterized delta-60 repeat protein